MTTLYQDKGFKNRRDYLESLAGDYDVSLDVVLIASDTLGESEDFDGLVLTLEELFVW